MLFKIKRTEKQEIALLMYSMENVMTYEKMLKDYKWFSLACGIKDNDKTLKLMREILKEGLNPIIAELRER